MILAWLIGSQMTESMIKDLSNKQKDSGGWVYTQLNRFENETAIDRVVVITVTDHYHTDAYFKCGKMSVYSIKDNPIRFFPNKHTFSKIDSILTKEKVDILDVQGTETMLSAYPVYASIDIPIINTLHGIAYQCYNFYTLGLPQGFLFFGRSFFDMISFHGIAESNFLMKRRAYIESQILKRIKNVRGRTNWDRSCALFINPNLNYFHTELIMRSAFYEYSWGLDKCNKNRVFVPQMRIPYKGCFILMQALKYVKQYYPDIEVHIPGAKIRSGFKKNGYEKYVWQLIRKNGLEKNVIFVGNLSAEQMAEELVEARVFVLPSIIENSPNSLTEAQLVGTPSVASMVGGVPDYIEHEKTGLLYNSMDPVMCAQNILRVLNDDELSEKMSDEAKRVAIRRHDPENITKEIIHCYQKILEDKRLISDEKSHYL